MNLRRKIFASALVAGSMVFASGCASVMDYDDDDDEQERPTLQYEFRVQEINDKLSVMLAPEGSPNASIDLIGEVSPVGGCLGITGTDQGDLTVVWPYRALVLNSKIGLEFPTIDADGDPSRARFIDKQEIVVTGEFVKNASWISNVPEGCEIPEDGVFLVQNASHPIKEADPEESKDEEG